MFSPFFTYLILFIVETRVPANIGSASSYIQNHHNKMSTLLKDFGEDYKKILKESRDEHDPYKNATLQVC